MFTTTPSQRLTALLKTGRHYNVSKGGVVFNSTDNRTLQLVERGYIKRYQITNNGAYSIQSIYGPHDIFPLTNIIKTLLGKKLYEGPETYFYEAISNARLYRLDLDAVVKAVDQDPLLYRDLLGVAAERLQSNIQQLENLSLPIYYQRVAHQLWFFCNKFSIKDEKGAKLEIPLTHQDLADILSTTRETVSVCMSKLKKEGLIVPGRYLYIPDYEKLKRKAFE
jgi:CRP-like cAMP-binding protein